MKVLSIRQRLAVAATGLVLAVVVVVAAAAYREVRRSAIAGASQRVENVSHQLSALFATSGRLLLEQARATARNSNIVGFLRDRTTATARGARAKLNAPPTTGNPASSVELWDRDGRRLLVTHDTVPPVGAADISALIALAMKSDGAAIGWIGGPAGHLGYSIISRVKADTADVGFVVERRRVSGSAQATNQLRDLIGVGTTLLVGNARGDLWTNFSEVVPSPPIAIAGLRGVVQYQRATGPRLLSSITGIRNTPWVIAVEFPLDLSLAPARELLWRSALFALLLLIATAAGAWALSGTLTRPIATLVTAAEGMRAGDLARRIVVGRRDELGALAMAFNGMAERIARSRVALEHTADDLRASEEHTRRIIETALDAVITIDATGVISGWNPQAEAIFGWPHAEAIGRSLATTIVPERDRSAHQHGLGRYVATGGGVIPNKRIELAAVHRDGHEFPIELSITPITRGKSGVVFSAFVRDITDRKTSELKVQAQLGRLHLLHLITRAIGERRDLRGIFEVVIANLEQRLAIDFGSILLYDQMSNVLTVACVGARSAALASTLDMMERSVVEIDENGLSRCVRGQLVNEPDVTQVPFPFPQRLAVAGLRSMVVAPLLVENQVFGVLVAARHAADSFSSGECEFLRQLSEHVALAAHQAELQTALHAAYADLRQTQQAVVQQERLRALGQMASGIAHDINNAISPVSLYTETLLATEPNLSATARGYLETIARSIDDVAATVARMREFYRQREPQLTLVPVHLNQLVQEVIDLTRARWSDMPLQRGTVISMRPELASDLPIVLGVASDIREALTNLIFNAVDALPDGGTVTVRTQVGADALGAHDAFVFLEVADDGAGMDDATQRRCLEPFFTTKGERGTGLGLAMVYGVVQRHGADIEIESIVGDGTTVRIIFGAAADVASESAEFGSTGGHLPPLRILAVDDDPVLLQSLHDTLEIKGHHVTMATGGLAGIDAFREAEARGEPFPVVITDLGMPHVDGRKVASAVKSLSPATFVILLTGWGQRLVADGDVPAHVDCVVNKPPRVRDLDEALARTLHVVEA